MLASASEYHGRITGLEMLYKEMCVVSSQSNIGDISVVILRDAISFSFECHVISSKLSLKEEISVHIKILFKSAGMRCCL